MVEGAGNLHCNEFQNCVQISHNVARQDPNDPIALTDHVFVTMIVALGPLAEIMGIPINFDDEVRIANKKVSDVGSKGMLSANLETQPASPKLIPQHHFGWAHRAPKLAGCIN